MGQAQARGSGGTNVSRGSRVGANGSPRKGQGFGGCFKSMAPYVGSILLVYKMVSRSWPACLPLLSLYTHSITLLTKAFLYVDV